MTARKTVMDPGNTYSRGGNTFICTGLSTHPNSGETWAMGWLAVGYHFGANGVAQHDWEHWIDKEQS